MSDMASAALSSAPNARIIDFDRAELRRVPFQDSLYLWVSARVPGASFEFRLVPRIYHGRPEYWGIEVVAIKLPPAANDIGAAAEATTSERSVPLAGIIGTRGIAVIGVHRTQHIEIDGGSV